MTNNSMNEKQPITNSKLKAVDTKNPLELRKSLYEADNLSRLSGGEGNTPEQIERIIQLHCEEGLSLDESVSKALEESDDGFMAALNKRAEQLSDEEKQEQGKD